MGGRGRAVVLGALLLAAIQLSGCADATRYVGVGLHEEAFIIEGVPSIRQGPELSCGPACVASVATYWTHAIPPSLREAAAPFRKKEHLRHGPVRGGEKRRPRRLRLLRHAQGPGGLRAERPARHRHGLLRHRRRSCDFAPVLPGGPAASLRSLAAEALDGRHRDSRRRMVRHPGSRCRQVPGAEDAPHQRLEAKRLHDGAPGAASAAGLGFRSLVHHFASPVGLAK